MNERSNAFDSAGEPRVAAYPQHARRRARAIAPDVFVAEGRHIVRRVVESGRYRVQSLLVNDAALRELEPLLARLPMDVPIFVGEAKDLAAVAGYDVHRGCLALVHRPAAGDSRRRYSGGGRCSWCSKAWRTLTTSEVIFRNAAAFGAGGVLLSRDLLRSVVSQGDQDVDGCDVAGAVRALGTDDWPRILVRIGCRLDDCCASRRASRRRRSTRLPRGRVRRGCALIVGTEGDGLTAAAAAAADHRVRIPISERVDSLNVAVAAAIAMHRLTSPL